MFKHLLVPTDGSETAAKAATVAADLAARYGARASIVSVVDPVPFFGSVEASERRSPITSMPRNRLRARASTQRQRRCVPRGSPLRVRSFRNIPGQAIIATAAKNGCDLIVMGSHGRRGLDAVLLGSVAHKVLTLAKLPVFIVK